ncbi:hypothetical protein Agub_g4989 [Astrephomene gubernaculifera]|uniref:Uncharacterized protein n=1 Tax=Astrephomene gubernaculifera TaxID=47775 RepID=A0AAD3DQ52_9CHLO|nr:hypothetical protein Agub_g4989 [Astrephomene gubernaculifera]
MRRLGLTATNALAGCGVPAAASALPTIAACAPRLTTIHRTASTCSYNSWCPNRPCLTQAAAPCNGVPHKRGGLLRAAAAVVPAALAATAAPHSTSAPVLCDPSAYQSLSLLILLHECVRRVYGRPLLEAGELLSLSTQLDSLPCCVLLLAPPPPPPVQASPLVAPVGAAPPSSAPAAGASAPASTVSAAESPFGSIGEAAAGRLEGGVGGSSSGKPSLRDDGRSAAVDMRATASDTSTSSSSGSGEGSSSSSGGGIGRNGGGSSMRVQYMNRAAAEALKACGEGCKSGGDVGSGGGGGGGSRSRGSQGDVPRSISWPLFAAEEDGGRGLEAVLKELMAAQGPPRSGQLRPLTLRTGAARQGSGSGAVQGSITCPEALLLPLMSPNGRCAGVAILFDRWEVRGTLAAPPQPQQQQQPQPQQQQGLSTALLEGRPLVPEVPYGSQPAPEAVLAALREAVRGQADAVRVLKTQQGLANTDPRVTSAVAQLQHLKAELELQQRLAAAFSEGNQGVVRRLLAGPGPEAVEEAEGAPSRQ